MTLAVDSHCRRAVAFHRSIIFLSAGTKFYSGTAPLTGSLFGFSNGFLVILLFYASLFALLSIARGRYTGSPGLPSTDAALAQIYAMRIAIPIW